MLVAWSAYLHSIRSVGPFANIRCRRSVDLCLHDCTEYDYNDIFSKHRGAFDNPDNTVNVTLVLLIVVCTKWLSFSVRHCNVLL
jgi:hypothetical protein